MTNLDRQELKEQLLLNYRALQAEEAALRDQLAPAQKAVDAIKNCLDEAIQEQKAVYQLIYYMAPDEWEQMEAEIHAAADDN